MPTVVHGEFEWDADKANQNVSKHSVAFDEAALAMRDSLAITSTIWLSLRTWSRWRHPPLELSCTS